MTAIRLTPAARSDLAAIWTYTATTWGVDQADSYVSALHRDMMRLTDFPELGAAHRSRHGAFRKLPSGHHLIFYRNMDDRVEIIRILHERMDSARHL